MTQEDGLRPGPPRPTSADVRAHVERHATRTPLLPSWELSEQVGRPVLLKAECLQRTGSFKVRGAAARLEALTEAERAAGVVACSSGNHGRAVSFVAGRLGIPARVFVPEWVDPVKLEGIRAGGADAVLTGATFDESEARAIEAAAQSGATYVSAYDDPWVIAGQGTIGLEIAEQAGGQPVDAVLAALSGGGLIGGIAGALGAETPGPPGRPVPTIVAVSAARAAVMLASLRAGRPVEVPEEETLANALAGGIGLENRWSFDLVRSRVDEHVTVDEDEIAGAMHFAATRLRLVVEGGGAVALAGLVSGGRVLPEGEGAVVVVLSGGNVAGPTLREVLGRTTGRGTVSR